MAAEVNTDLFSFDWPLKHFQEVVEREWNRLLKDYTVALHDDAEVLQILISRVCKEMED